MKKTVLFRSGHKLKSGKTYWAETGSDNRTYASVRGTTLFVRRTMFNTVK
jgi:hypothetical protein